MKRRLCVNGFETEACYADETVETVFFPLLDDLNRRYTQAGHRQIVFLAGPPAAGKSTLALFLEELSAEKGYAPLQALGMDGFHYPNAYLQTHSTVRNGETILLARIKGSPQTYDVQNMEALLGRIRKDFEAGRPCTDRWPAYDRNIHDVVPEKYPITGEILLIEGNYLLLDDPSWASLHTCADATVMVRCREEALQERLVFRKMRGGMEREAAVRWYEQNDRENIMTVLQKSRAADHEIVL